MGEPDVLLHDVPFPKLLRIGLCIVGVVVAVLATSELGRGVWPLNVTSPFFAAMIVASWAIAFAAISSGLFTPPRVLEFRHGQLTVCETLFRTTKRTTYAVTDLVALACKIQESSDGPDMHYVEITTTSGDILKSRMFDTGETARKCEAEFRRALGL
jgi:hypothetical protein